MNPRKLSTSPMNVWLDPHPALDGVALIDHLFNRLDGLYPHRWRSAFANEHAIANWRQAWAEGLTEEGVTMAEVKRGLAECRRLFDWPPSFAEFVKACRPPIDAKAEWAEAVEQMRIRLQGKGEDRWSRPQVYWAASAIGQFDLNQNTWEQIKARWTHAIENAKDDPIPEYRAALPAPGKATTTREDAAIRLREIAEKTGITITQNGPGNVKWA